MGLQTNIRPVFVFFPLFPSMAAAAGESDAEFAFNVFTDLAP